MRTVRALFCLVFCFLSIHSLYSAPQNVRYKVGLCITATGRYDQFISKLIESARKHFCTSHDVTYFVFTDGTIPTGPDIVRIEQKRLGWPYDTMMRFQIYASHRGALANMDYLFATDADMLFVDKVGGTILSPLTATQHPGFVNKRGSYETNARSLACVKKKEGKTYFAGGFWGGSRDEFLKACEEMNRRIHIDLKNNIIPVWHDESHLNRYLIDFPPTRVLSPAYCYPESVNIPYKKRLIALDKNHNKLRKSLPIQE